MKRLLITTSILITFFGLVLTASPYLLKLFGIDNSVKRFVLSEIIDNSKGQLDVRNFQIGLGNIKLSDVSLNSTSKKFNISLESIEFNFNFFKLFSSPTKPQNAIESVHLIKPKLVLSSNEKLDIQDENNKSLTKTQIKEVFLSVSKLSTIDKIQISDGQIIWRSPENNLYPLVENLNGWLAANSIEDMNIEARGRLFSTKNDNFFLNSKIDFEREYVDASVLINEYQINSSDYPFISDKVSLDSGIVASTIHFQNNGFSLDSTVLNGEINLTGLNLNYNNRTFSNINLKAVIDTNTVSISDGRARYNDTRIQLNAHVDDILKPLLVSDIKLNHLNLNDFYSSEDSSFLSRAYINSDVHLEYGAGEKRAEITAWTDKLAFGKNEFIEDFRTKAVVNSDSIDIKNITGLVNNFRITGKGYYIRPQNLLSLHLGSHHIFGNHVLLDRLSKKELLFDISLLMNTKTGVAHGKWLYQLENESDTLLFAEGNIKGGTDNRLTISLLNSNQKNFFANIEIEDYLNFKIPTISNARIVNFPFYSFTSNTFIKRPVMQFDTDMQLNGTMNNLTGNIDIIDKKNFKNRFNLNVNIENLFTNQRNYSGTIQIKNLAGDFRFMHNATFFGGAFNFANEIDGYLKIDIKGKEQISGEVNFNKFKFIKALTDSLISDDLEEVAAINGKINLAGNLDSPRFDAQLFADKIVINNIGYYQIETDLAFEKDILKTNKLIFYLNNIPVLNGNLKYSISNQQIAGSFNGTDVDVDPIVSTIKPDNLFLKGHVNYFLALNGKIDAPKLSGNLKISNGELKNVAFDNLEFSFSDSLKPGYAMTDIKNHILSFHDLNFEKSGKYQVSGSGNIPFNNTDPLSVDGSFVGDILSFIPRLNKFFVDGSSLAEIEFRLGGNTNRIRIKSGYAEIEKGELWLQKVVPYIENIHGRIEIAEGTNQVNFKNFKAEVDGAVLTINTVRDITLPSGTQLDSWYFKGTDLDFGILQLETSDRGITVNIPGLMLDDDNAKFYLSGMNKNEKFYFAGPVKHPQLRGTLTLYDSRFTFPFLTTNKPGADRSVVVEFLENINWDVLVKSGEDVVYFREIPAYIDNVYTEAYIDETSKGIHFKGIIEKGSFKPEGFASSSRGRLEYLDQTFRVDHFNVEFNKNDLLPYVSGRAWTTIRDSVGAIPRTIYLQLYVTDPETGEEKQQGSWEDFKFKLVSADPQLGETQEQVLASLGFSVGNIKDKATSVGSAVTERILIRPLLRPIERVLEKSLGVDLVRINSNIARNLFYSSVNKDYEHLAINPVNGQTPYLFLMQSSELTVGKYISQDLYLTYTGQLVSLYDQSQSSFDFNHSFGIEYRFLRNVLLEIEYDRELMGYLQVPNQKQYLEDIKIRLRHSFAF